VLLLPYPAVPADRATSPDARPAAADDPLRQSLEQYRSLFQHNPLPMMVFDAATLRFLEVNHAAEEQYGYSADEFLRLSIADIRPAEDVPRLLRSIEESDRTGFHHSGHWRHRTRDGRTIWVEVWSRGVAHHGRPARLVLCHEVTERLEVQEALRSSEERYRAVFDQSPLGVVHFDRELRVLGCNPPLAAALGYATCEELAGLDLLGLDDQRILPPFREALSGERSLYEGPFRARRWGVRGWIAAHVSPLFDSDGQVVGGTAIIEDITARRLVESRLARQARELEQANAELRLRTEQLEEALRARNRLYTSMNHELRTPISAIMLFNDILLDGALGPLEPPQLDSVQQSQRAAQHLLELVQDMLDLGRLEAGRMALVAEEVALCELLRDLLGTVRPLAEQRGSELRAELPDDGSCQIMTDPRRVRQVVLNLLTNALKFGHGRPITVSLVTLAAGGVEIVVADRGSGIAPADHERIFEDFVQVGLAGEGSGLGLSVSRRLAEALGGSLNVESEPGRGSDFRLHLPAAMPPGGARTIPEHTSFD
jgi:PAS domain S-box-containing protein